jgi:cytochrome b561
MAHQVNYKNNSSSYGSIAKWLHWLTAILFMAAYVSVYYRQWFTEDKTPENWTALQLHLSIGVTLGVLVALRIFWRLFNEQPKPEPASELMHLVAKLGHLALYGVMILMPLTGYLGTGVNTEFYFLADIPKFASTAFYQSIVVDGFGLTFEQIEPAIDYIHKDIFGRWLVWMLIVGHAGAALYHHYALQDKTLIKML